MPPAHTSTQRYGQRQNKKRERDRTERERQRERERDGHLRRKRRKPCACPPPCEESRGAIKPTNFSAGLVRARGVLFMTGFVSVLVGLA